MKKNSSVGIVGGGIAGIVSGIWLLQKGFDVELFEKNPAIGGKMSEEIVNSQVGEFRFDTGPSLLTMPFVFDELFENVGKNRADYVEFVPIDPICRYFYPTGDVLDAYSNRPRMKQEIMKFSAHDAHQYDSFIAYSERIYERTADIFLFTPFQEIRKLLKKEFLPTLLKIHQIDAWRTVHKALKSFFTDDRIIQIFDRYATYNGSNPFSAPATLNIIPYVEYELGGYYVRGGMYALAKALERLFCELGGVLHCSSEVKKIVIHNRTVHGLQLVSEEEIKFDYVVCNSDVVVTHELLIDEFAEYRQKLRGLEPSLSGFVFLWGIRDSHQELQHHNIFFSTNYELEFHQLFHDKSIPDDLTVYVSITSKSDFSHAPDGCENWFVLVNLPAFDGLNTATGENFVFSDEYIAEVRKKVLFKLSECGIDVENKIVCEKVISPKDMYLRWRSNRGSIYGISSNNQFSAFLRPPNRSKMVDNLFFAGGSSHPGGGVPLVALSGKMAADLLEETFFRSKR